MSDIEVNINNSFITSFITSLLFILLSTPETYKLTNKITTKYGFSIATDEGRPYANGLFLHSLLVFYLTFFILSDKLYVFLPGVIVFSLFTYYVL